MWKQTKHTMLDAALLVSCAYCISVFPHGAFSSSDQFVELKIKWISLEFFLLMFQRTLNLWFLELQIYYLFLFFNQCLPYIFNIYALLFWWFDYNICAVSFKCLIFWNTIDTWGRPVGKIMETMELKKC